MVGARRQLLLCGAFITAVWAAAPAHGAPPTLLGRVTATAAILVDYPSGEILFARNPDLELPPASTTKILTAYIALKSGRLGESVAVSSYASQMQPSKIGLRPGWRMNLEDLVYAILLNSANDAAVAIAEGLSGSVERFASLMNRTAWHMGALSSHFVNPNGLPADGHYSTVRDLTTIMRHALQVDALQEVLATRQTSIRPVSGSRRGIALRTHNRLLTDPRTAVIGKTGYTRSAKKCFVGAATQDGRRVLVAVLGSTDLWGDLRRLIDWVYDNPVDPSLERDPPDELDWREAAAAPPGIPKPGTKRSAARSQGDTGEAKETKQRYRVQAGAFRSRSTADHLRRKMASTLGYSTIVEPVTVKRRTLYRVSVQGIPSHAAALKVAETLKRAYKLSPRVVSG